MRDRSKSRQKGEGSPGGGRVVSIRLDNGVWVLVLPMGEPPGPGYRGVASVQLWVGAGSAAERAREHGCAHLFEHMVFKPFVDPEGNTRDLAGALEHLGGDVNAFTSHDETVFHATVPADVVGETLDVMSWAVIGREVSADVLAREQEVVVEEIRQYADDPSARALSGLMAELYGDHPYGRSVLGEEAEVRTLDPGALRAWQRRQYRGERLCLVVAGPVEVEAIQARARRLLGSLSVAKRRSRQRRPVRLEGARVHVVREDVQEAYLRLGWIGGASILDADAVALDLAAVALGQGESSRLARRTRRRDRLVSEVYSSFLPGLAAGTFLLSAQADPGLAQEAVEALLGEVDALRRRAFEPDELRRARVLLQSSLVYRRETVQGQGYALGYYATATGRLGAEAEYFRILDELGPEQVREACARHLVRERAAIRVSLPRDRVSAATARSMTQALSRTCRPPTARGGETARGGARRSRGPERDAFGTWHARLACGLRVVARPEASVPVAAGWLVWPGGLRLEAPREGGISSLTAALLNRGTTVRTGDDLSREVEGLAAVLDGFAGHNSVGMQLESLSEHLPTILDRAIECVMDPLFDPDELEEARRIVLADLDADADDLGHLAYREMLSALYGRHPHGRDLRGTRESVGRLDQAALQQSWRRRYPLGRAVLALAGELELELVLAELAELFGRVDEQGAGASDLEWPGRPPKWPRRPIERRLEKGREQGHIVLGFPGLQLGDAQGAALDVLCTVLGGQAGRLFESLRERSGLVYQVAASSSEHVDSGHVVFYAAASQDKLVDARAALEREIARVRDEAIDEAELERAKLWLIGQFESGLQRRSRVASRMVFGEVYGLGANYYLRYPERVSAVEREQVLALARRLLDPRSCVTVVAT